MSVYHWLVVLILLCGLFMRGQRNGNYKFILISAVLLFCVLGLRDAYSIGNDSSSSYLHQFQRMEGKEWSDLGGPFDWVQDLEAQTGKDDKNAGLQYVMKLVYDLTDGDYQVFVALIGFFVILANAHLVKKYSPAPLQSVLYFLGLLYFTFHFNALKQSVAMVFILYSFDAIVDRRPVKFLFLLALASIFHYPSLVFLPAYWIGNMKLGRNYIFLLSLLLALVFLFRDRIVEFMADAYYGEDSGHAVTTDTRFFMNKVIVMLVIIAAALVIRPPHPSDRVYCSLLALMGIATVLQTFAAYGNIFERLADYYFQFSIVFIPLVFENVQAKRQYLETQTLYLIRNYGPYLFCAFAIWRFLNSTMNDATIYPYHFYFQVEKPEDSLSIIQSFMR